MSAGVLAGSVFIVKWQAHQDLNIDLINSEGRHALKSMLPILRKYIYFLSCYITYIQSKLECH